MEEKNKQENAGHAVYTRFTLSIYDLWVLKISNLFIWECASGKILELYNANISANHLDIGVGTGYFLNYCKFPAHTPRLALMDINRECLKKASGRLARYKPEIYIKNIMAPLDFKEKPFNSIGLNYLLHCLPGKIEEKTPVFENIKPLLLPGGTVFGSTLIASGTKQNSFAKKLTRIYNSKGIFSNQNDSLSGLEKILKAHFTEIKIKIIGCAALFSGRKE